MFTENHCSAEFWGSKDGLVQIPRQHQEQHGYLLCQSPVANSVPRKELARMRVEPKKAESELIQN